MRKSVADYLRLAVAELEREANDHPPFSEQRAQIVADANTLRDLLHRNGEATAGARIYINGTETS